MGTIKLVVVPALMDTGRVQLTVCPVVVQPQPLVEKLAGAVIPVGKLVITATGPLAVAVPTLLTLTGKLTT
ncbi:hypothetical protein GCM10028816_50770 [Spirosoma lituiforme]